jgi:hypothetical protein
LQVSDSSLDLQQQRGEKKFDLEQRLEKEHENCGSLWKLASSLVELGAPFCPLKNSEIKYRNRQSWWQHGHTGHTRRGKQKCDRSVLEEMQQQQQEDHHHSGMDSFIMCGKYVRYTNEQVEALEHVYHECPKPSSIRRQQLIKDCPILAHIEPKQIKVWFQNRRYVCVGHVLMPPPPSQACIHSDRFHILQMMMMSWCMHSFIHIDSTLLPSATRKYILCLLGLQVSGKAATGIIKASECECKIGSFE